MMKILHWNNTGNQGVNISRGQRGFGHKSDCVVTSENYFRFGADYNLEMDRKGYVSQRLAKLRAFMKFAIQYDVFHFHTASIFPIKADLPLLKMLGKRVIMHYHGFELIMLFDPTRALALYGGSYSGRDLTQAQIKSRMAQRFANALLVSEPDLLPYVPGAIWVRQPTDLDYWNPSGESDCNRISETIKIGHAPSTKGKKGTQYIVSAVDQLKSEGYNVELLLAHGVPHNEVKQYVEQADIFVDQLRVGWYGNAACEAMALKKPVCVYIRQDLEQYLGTCPVVNANPENIVEKLRVLLEDRDMREELGERGREYVKKYHDMHKIAKDLLELYAKV
jgi:glycosyltransferase involved in cell wall biosynthesis